MYVYESVLEMLREMTRPQCHDNNNADNGVVINVVVGDFNLARLIHIAQIGIYHVNTYINAHCFILILYEPWNDLVHTVTHHHHRRRRHQPTTSTQ